MTLEIPERLGEKLRTDAERVGLDIVTYLERISDLGPLGEDWFGVTLHRIPFDGHVYTSEEIYASDEELAAMHPRPQQ